MSSADKLSMMKVFVSTIQHGSLTRAAIELEIAVSSVSKSIRKLEQDVGIALLNRTTKSLVPTDAGKEYFDFAKRILGELIDFEESLKGSSIEPFGTVKILAPAAIGQFVLAPELPKLMLQFPKLKIQLMFSEERLDSFDDRYDIQITSLAPAKNSRVYCQSLAQRKRVIVGSPEFINRYGKPLDPVNLESLPLLSYKGQQVPYQWTFSQGSKQHSIHPGESFVSNSYLAVVEAAIAGVGLANVYEYLVSEYLKNGRLLTCLDDWVQEARVVYALYTQRRETSQKIDRALHFLTAVFKAKM